MQEANGEKTAGLAERILAGDRNAESELVEFFGPRVFAILCARTQDREASRDLLHDALIGILKALRQGELRDAGKLPAFIASVARNIAHTHLRGRARARLSQPIEEDDAASPSHGDAFEAAERQTQVRQALLQLDRTDREILTRILADGQKLAAIAGSLGMSQEAVRQRKSRALKKVTEIVKGL
jgi:RNA polymerase sigma-70 factor (ECF subfamily)